MLSYLNSRKVVDREYRNLLLSGDLQNCVFKLCSVKGFDFMMSHFLGQSDEAGYGLIPTNHILGLDGSNQLAIGLLEGDDVVCMNLDDGSINLWLLEMADGKRINVAASFKELLEMCSEK